LRFDAKHAKFEKIWPLVFQIMKKGRKIRTITMQSKPTFYILFSFLLFTACEFDQGLGVLKSRISGQVVYVNADSRPDNIDEVRVVAVANFPPSGLSDVFFSEAIPFERDTANYEILLPFGEYPAVGVLWKPRGKDWSFTSLLGFYGFEPPASASLLPVNLTPDEPFATNVDIFALWDLAKLDGEISGTVTFRGELPENTDTVLLAAFTGVPDLSNVISLLAILGGLPLPVPLKNIADGVTYDYRLPVRSDEYKFVGAFWISRGGFETIRLIGFFPDSRIPAIPGSFIVPENGAVSDVDFVADFGILK
jgi:hypothetical protein